jgi:hypothetical protein
MGMGASHFSCNLEQATAVLFVLAQTPVAANCRDRARRCAPAARTGHVPAAHDGTMRQVTARRSQRVSSLLALLD